MHEYRVFVGLPPIRLLHLCILRRMYMPSIFFFFFDPLYSWNSKGTSEWREDRRCSLVNRYDRVAKAMDNVHSTS